MGLKEDFFAWKAANPNASRQEKEAKLLEMKQGSTSGQRTIEQAKLNLANNPAELAKLKAMERGPEAFQEELKYQSIDPLTRAMYPNISRATAKGSMFSPFSGLADAASMIPRVYESSVYKMTGGDRSFGDRMAQTEGTGIVSEAVRSPYNLIPSSGVARGLTAAAKPLMQRALGYGVRGALETVPSAAMEQARRVEEGRGISGAEVTGEIAAGGLLPFGAKALSKVGKPAKEFLKDVMAEASGRSKQLLETVGDRELAEWAKKSVMGEKAKPDAVLEKLRNYTDNAEQIADEVIKTVDDFDVLYRKNNDVIEKSIAQMPEMDTQPLINKLELSKIKLPPGNKAGFSGEMAFNGQIDGLINRIKGKVRQKNENVSIFDMPSSMDAPLTHISASDMLDIRRDIDRSINWNAETFSKAFYSPIQKFKKNARGFIKESLEKEADNMGDAAYSKVMKDYSKQLDLQDDVKRALLPRANDLGETDRVNNFLLRMGNPNKLDARKFAGKFKKLLGRDLFEDANFLRLSKEYRDALPIANDIKTGRKNWLQGFASTTGGKIATAPFSSPKIAAPLTAGLDAASAIPKMYGPVMEELMRSGQTEYIGE